MARTTHRTTTERTTAQTPAQRPRTLRSRVSLALASLCVLLLATACPRDGDRGHGSRGVLLIAIDSLRADHLSAMGYDRRTTPVLDGLAQRGALFTQTFGVAPAYLPAHAGLLTGCDPGICVRPRLESSTETGFSARWWVPRAIPSLAGEYLAAGYSTAAFVDHPWISPTYGFDRGFQEFHRFQEDDVVGYDDYGFEGVVLRFRRWRRALKGDRDWFAYLSVTDLDRSWQSDDELDESIFEPRPELDWVPPVTETGRSYFAIPNDRRQLWSGGNETLAEYELRYDRTLRRLDKRIGRMLEELAREGRLENTTICIVGTFGVGFGESGLILDTGTLSDVDQHVPWVLSPARDAEIEHDRRCDGLASLLDVAPTLLELSGIELPSGMHGRSQVPVLRREVEAVREFAFSRGGVQAGFAVRDQRYNLEHTVPGGRGAESLRRSWTGQSATPKRFTDHLTDRTAGGGPGNQGPGLDDPETTRRLREAGSQWYRWIDEARAVVHEIPWDHDPVDPALLRELIENGIVAP